MTRIAIIGGTGLTSLAGLEITGTEEVQSKYGAPSGPLTRGSLSGREVVFLPRHGAAHTIPPHKVNYRANIAALKQAGVTDIIAVNAVGGITPEMQAGVIAIPDQLIDYTWAREHTFFDGSGEVVHIDFTQPYCESLRSRLLEAGRQAGIDLLAYGTYAVTQGPRLETPAEINRLERDGCHLVGMTAMPEAALARELELCYAGVSVVANMAAGRGEGEITMEEIDHNLRGGMARVRQLLETAIPLL